MLPRPAVSKLRLCCCRRSNRDCNPPDMGYHRLNLEDVMVIRFEPKPVEPTLPEPKKPVAVSKSKPSPPVETPQSSLPLAKPVPRGTAKSRRQKA